MAAWKMDQTTIIVFAVVGSLGVLSAILGFSAEGTKLTYGLWYYGDCYYRPNPALGLGVCATIFMIIAQVVLAVVGGCCGCCRSRAMPTETNQTVGVVCAVASWIAAVIAFALLVAGASASGSGYRYVGTFGVCDDGPASGIFAGGAVLTLAATALGLASYFLLRGQPAAAVAAAAPDTGGDEQLPADTVGIPMGEPQFPQKPRPQGFVQAPQPNMGGGGQQLPAAAPGIAMGKPPRPKFPKFTLRSQGPSNNVELVYQENLQGQEYPQPEYQNEIGTAGPPEGEAQAYGEEQLDGTAPTLSYLPEAEACGVEHFDGAEFEF